MRRNTVLLVAGALTLGVVPALYARWRRKPLPYRAELRQRQRLSEELAEATELAAWTPRPMRRATREAA